MSCQIITGDCAAMLTGLEPASVDALVTDPPAGISFMGKDWDSDRGGRAEWVAWLAGVMRECLRVMKPGAHGLVWALPRTSHWTATALEDAGFEVRDVITHHFGTGFPKSKALLKPASEHWILVRKPGPLQHLNIDACRIQYASAVDMDQARVPQPAVRPGGADSGHALGAGTGRNGEVFDPSKGRWPANLVLSHADDCAEACAEGCPVRELDGQSGISKSAPLGTVAAHRARPEQAAKGAERERVSNSGHGDSGGASRFFYVAKPSKAERGADNKHPTVKSIALMSWLIRLITPPGGLVLDPFAGSGTTGVAAVRGGWRFVGIEREAEYARLAEARLRAERPVRSHVVV